MSPAEAAAMHRVRRRLERDPERWLEARYLKMVLYLLSFDPADSEVERLAANLVVTKDAAKDREYHEQRRRVVER